MARLRVIAQQLRSAVRDFEPDRWSGADCVALAEELAATAKACTAAAARAAARAVECNQRNVEWVARTSGSTPSQARETLATVAALAECPATSDAVASGAVSLTQAREIVAAEAVVPGSENSLLEVATSTGMHGLRDEARRVRLGAIDRDVLHAERRRVRSVTHWIDELGMVAGRFRLLPEVGMALVNRLDAEADRIVRVARREGRDEPREAHAADAFVSMLSRAGKRAPRAEVVFVADLAAMARGHTHGDELCHVIGAGPLPVAVVRKAAVSAAVKVAVRDGTKLDTIVHHGRHIPAELRTALELGDPGRLDGAVCVEDGCDRRYGLEADHDDPFANGGATSYENIKLRCGPDHRAKTERDRKSGLLGPRAP